MKPISKEPELNNQLKQALNMPDINGITTSLRNIADVMDKWNKTVGFEDSVDLTESQNSVSILRITANIIERINKA